MKLVLVTDAWLPHVNRVVTTLVELVRQLQSAGHEVVVVHPGQFHSRPCPGFAGLDIALLPGRQLGQMLVSAQPDAIHIATEGPLGWSARRHCMRRGLPFTSAFHTRLPERLHAALGLPLDWGYAVLRRFHRTSQAVLVPTRGVLEALVQRGFTGLRECTQGVDTRQFTFAPQATDCPGLGHLARPVSLYVGRVSYEKNIAAFLDLDVPGSKVVCGTGPLAGELRLRYPNVHWLGVLPRQELAQVYAAADVLVYPSRHDTFGLVMLEALACGVPVAAYAEDGPLQVLGDSGAGAMHENLEQAWHEALRVPRHLARQRALQFGWSRVAELFSTLLAPLPRQMRRARHDAASRPVPLSGVRLGGGASVRDTVVQTPSNR